MSKIRIVIPNESSEHSAWSAKIREIEKINPEERTEGQWAEIAKLYETEPAFGEGAKTYYVPALDEMPAEKIRCLPKELFTADKDDQGAAFDALVALLSMYMPNKAARGLTIGQMQDVMKLVKGDGTGES